ncbi:uncharacterized protein FOMMEDRAFT_28909 [Fomitiporia mediterranea MF3/22]|uniref:uncharacterized protein n=1 Tax=Fomitiporia mediterranea (strain MF3/22) TaxID=694068 RepID=UPI0004407281|nr:uncharacterized protein FOMMEDRAFT_28909 [Fomitiporia mediterranea MF3/22]EJD03426.1 hypothetical protein FOMMEDRAFT_28909 [Fomitiporia mediterranea MF3/22]
MTIRHLSSSRSKPLPASSASSTSDESDDDSHSHSSVHSHSHSHSNSHSHSHSHSVFGSHSHSRDDEPHQDVEGIMQALQGKGDRGSRITLLGLVVNVGLTGAKGAAGWYMNSAALLAEAGHSASDLLGDLVTLFAWRFSRRTPTLKYPYGFGKFETLGTTTVALILIGGALGIGVHSFTLLTHHLVETAASLPPGPAQVLVQNVTEVAQTVATAVPSAHSHAHIHGAELALDPNAAWFALASVIIKEWLYRITKRVATAENSGVLLANAIHHRADAYTSAVALVAILGTWAFPALPLDPLGGLLVAMVILKQGAGLFMGAFGELTDASVSSRTRRSLENALVPLLEEGGVLKGIDELRAMRAGALLFVDVKVRVSSSLPVSDASALETRIREALIAVRKEIAEVRVKFVPESSEQEKERIELERDDSTTNFGSEKDGRL